MAISKQATTQKTTAQNSISLSQYGTHPPEFEALVSSSNWEIKKELRWNLKKLYQGKDIREKYHTTSHSQRVH